MAGPFVIPQIGTFRVLTGTVGVDLYDLSYYNYCMDDGAADMLARTIDDLDINGMNALSDDALFPNAPILRVAEGVDAIANAVKSAAQPNANAAAGKILCTVCELGGILYTMFLVLIAIGLLGLLPLVNFMRAHSISNTHSPLDL